MYFDVVPNVYLSIATGIVPATVFGLWALIEGIVKQCDAEVRNKILIPNFTKE